jgi:hypothetical protein
MRMIVLCAMLGLLSACASAPNAPATDEFVFVAPLQSVKQARHVRIEVAADRAALRGVRRIAIPQVRLSSNLLAADITPRQQALLTNAAGRAACTELAKRFELSPPTAASDAEVQLVLTAIRSSSATASGLSALVGIVVPGPSRLPLGLGGLAGQAQAVGADGQTLLSYRWARGARSVAEDASMSRIGDAWQLARMFGRDVGRELAAQLGPKADRRRLLSADTRRTGRALCAQVFGTTPLIGRGLGKLLPLSPEAMDAGAPLQEADPDVN